MPAVVVGVSGPRAVIRRWPSILPAALAVALLAGCGVAGRPLPPGPTPPGPAGRLTVRSTPEGLELSAALPTTDLDGTPLTPEPPLRLAVFVDRADCHGQPDALGPPPLTLAVKEPVEVRVVVLRGDRAGPASPPQQARWTEPPPAPEAPLAFVDATRAVQLSWLPPPPPASRVRVLRDGAQVAEAPVDAAGVTDAPPAGEHAYILMAVGPTFVTGPSPASLVLVPPESP